MDNSKKIQSDDFLNNEFFKEICGVPDLLRSRMAQMTAQVRQLLTAEEINGLTDIYLTGCGDSYMAAESALMAFTELTGLRVRANTSMTQSYYSGPFMAGKEKLVIAVSYSGETSRTIEAVKRMNRQGCLTMAVTCGKNSSLAKLAQTACVMEHTKWCSVQLPEVRSFVLLLTALYLLAIHIGRSRQVISAAEAGKLERDLQKTADIIEKHIFADIEKDEAFARLCLENNFAELIGAGSGAGAAKFGVAKIIEAAGVRAAAKELEEFAHVEYFENQPCCIPTILLGGENTRVNIRQKEVLAMLKQLKRPVLFLSCDETDEKWQPVIFSVRLSVLAAVMHMLGKTEYFRGFAGVWGTDPGAGVKDSKIVE